MCQVCCISDENCHIDVVRPQMSRFLCYLYTTGIHSYVIMSICCVVPILCPGTAYPGTSVALKSAINSMIIR
jgi:hypothetical protein